MRLLEIKEELGLPASFAIESQWWRLQNLYQIVNDDGIAVPFRLRPIQEAFLRNIWYRSLVLKSRQHGFTTVIDVWSLDCCLWIENITAAIIAHTRESAEEIFRTKVKYPFEHLPAEIAAALPAKTDRAQQLVWAHGSSIRVTTSPRSGTCQILHVSELGKIAKVYPNRAIEIITGALPAVHMNGYAFIESTAEGQTGKFYELATQARNHALQGKHFTRKTFRPYFYAWHEKPENRATPEDTEFTVIPERLDRYFRDLAAKHGIVLDAAQKAWYVNEELTLGDEMKRENPSHWEEAFHASIEGAYFKRQMLKLREDGRLTDVPHREGVAVDTWWDLGRHDYTSIIFTQDVGGWIHVIDYFEGVNEAIGYYLGVMDEWRTEKGYHYGVYTGPHDIENEYINHPDSAWEQANKLGIRFEVNERSIRKIDSINAGRSVFSIVKIDEAHCGTLVKRLDNYRREWDQNRGVWKDTPLHDENSHGADAWQELAKGHGSKPRHTQSPVGPAVNRPSPPRSAGWT